MREKYRETFIIEVVDECSLNKVVSSINFFDLQTKCANLNIYNELPWEQIKKCYWQFEMKKQLNQQIQINLDKQLKKIEFMEKLGKKLLKRPIKFTNVPNFNIISVQMHQKISKNLCKLSAIVPIQSIFKFKISICPI